MKIICSLSKRAALLLLLLLTVNLQLSAFAQGTAFTYQGRLNDGTNPANGHYDLRFAIYDDASAGTQQGNLLTNSTTAVSNGLFTATLDFGNQFPGAARWLDISVRTNGATSFVTLSPRQALTPVPYAITAGNVISGGLAAGNYANAVTFNNAANQFTGSFTGNGANVTNVNAASLGGLTSSNFWQTGGNAGTTASTNFVGTTDNQPLQLHVNRLRALRLEPTANDANHSNIVNVIGGSPVNSASNVYGATISGGGGAYYFGLSSRNQVNGDFGTVGGGLANISSALEATVGGGYANVSSGGAATIGGGYLNVSGNNSTTVAGGAFNSSLGLEATVGGGYGNTSSGDYATVGGGYGNSSSTNATVAGGAYNTSSGNWATVGGGYHNTSSTNFTTVAGGGYNTSSGDIATVGGGSHNTSSGNWATVSAGFGNTSSGLEATVGGGYANTSSGGAATIGGGFQNISSTNSTTVAGGAYNTSSGQEAAVGGGYGNTSSGDYAVVGGGLQNTNSGLEATVGGGYANTSSGGAATIGGGFQNVSSSNSTTVAGGAYNTSSGQEAAVGGGQNNTASGAFSAIAGGINNVASGNESVIGGGQNNFSVADWSVIAGGNFNTNNGLVSFIGSGGFNFIESSYSFIGGGVFNHIQTNAFESFIGSGADNAIQTNASNSAIVAGDQNTVQTDARYDFIGGGSANVIQTNTWFAVISGGANNTIQPNAGSSVIGGGANNTVGGLGAVVPGGFFNAALGYASFAAGVRAQATNDGAFVLTDRQNTNFYSTTSNQLSARFTGGVRIVTGGAGMTVDGQPVLTGLGGSSVLAVGTGASSTALQISNGGIKVTGAGIGTSTPVFVHRATGANIETPPNTHRTTITHPLCDGDPNAILIITHNYNPGNTGNILDTHPTSVYYNPTLSKWQIYHDDIVALTINSAWNVLVIKP